MPVIQTSTYRGTPLLFNGHLETIVPSMFRKVRDVVYTRERLELADGDFLDLDWLTAHSDRLVIISHGLEGSSDRHYVKGMAKYFHRYGWDALAWNCRSCSGEINRNSRMYHHGATDDLDEVVKHVLSTKQYQSIALIGFSMGGSITLKYSGEHPSLLSPAIKAAVVFSVPCDLASSAQVLDTPTMSFYRKRFLKKLGKKMQLKALQYPGLVRYEGFDAIRFFREFDDRYTAPLHGFRDAQDFYHRASAIHYISAIRIPTLIVNAANDPFLPPPCHPKELVRHHASVHLETPLRGGHVGFSFFNREENWMEVRALQFISEVI